MARSAARSTSRMATPQITSWNWHAKSRCQAPLSAAEGLYCRSGSIPENDENIATVFDRAADQVCRACPLCGTCWDNDYVTTYNALNDVTQFLTGRGRILPSDFPSHFSARCVRLSDFIAAVNAEFTALLMRRQYTRQLDSTRQSAKEQYARLSELLSESADQISRSDTQEAVPASKEPVIFRFFFL